MICPHTKQICTKLEGSCAGADTQLAKIYCTLWVEEQRAIGRKELESGKGKKDETNAQSPAKTGNGSKTQDYRS